MHRWFALRLLIDSAASEQIESNAPKPLCLDKIYYYLKKCVGVLYYSATYVTNGAAEVYLDDDGSTSRTNILIEKLIVVSLSVFIFFSVIIYGSSTAAGFVDSLNPYGPE